MAYQLLRSLEREIGNCARVAPVEVPEDQVAKWFSRVQKLLRVPRTYAYYSNRRLTRAERLLTASLPPDADALFFFGTFPFVQFRSPIPSYVYTDGSFALHYSNYASDHSYDQREIQRLCDAEAAFLKSARRVFVSSKWVASHLGEVYGLPSGAVTIVGTGPGLVPEPSGEISYANELLVIAADFLRKQGRIAFECVSQLRRHLPELRLVFLGAAPPQDILQHSWVQYAGWLDLKTPSGRDAFVRHLSTCRAQLLLSKADLTPLAIVEAAMYAKPTFACAVGGIPEMISDGESGLLHNPSDSPAQMAVRMLPVVQDSDICRRMGQSALQRYHEFWNWTRVGKSIAETIRA